MSPLVEMQTTGAFLSAGHVIVTACASLDFVTWASVSRPKANMVQSALLPRLPRRACETENSTCAAPTFAPTSDADHATATVNAKLNMARPGAASIAFVPANVVVLEASTPNRTYRWARRIMLFVDNSVIQNSQVSKSWLALHPKFQLVFQPPCCTWVNIIERLWKQLHDTVTRNHQHATMSKLMHDVPSFMNAASSFPGAGHALALAK